MAPGSGDRTSPVAEPEVVRRQLREHGLRSADEAAAAGVQLRRAFIFGSQGSLGVIAAQQLPGQPPTLSFHRTGRRDATLLTPISEEAWRSIVARTPGSAAPEPRHIWNDDEVCAEQWQVYVEGVGATDGRRPEVAGRSGGACSDPQAMGYALWLADMAARLIDPCARLSAEPADALGRLSTCSILQGDLESALQVVRSPQAFQSLGELEGSPGDDLLARTVVLRQRGEAFPGRSSVLGIWRTIRADPQLSGVEFDLVRGIDRNRVELSGRLVYVSEEGALVEEREFTALWVRGGGVFRLVSISIGPVLARQG